MSSGIDGKTILEGIESLINKIIDVSNISNIQSLIKQHDESSNAVGDWLDTWKQDNIPHTVHSFLEMAIDKKNGRIELESERDKKLETTTTNVLKHLQNVESKIIVLSTLEKETLYKSLMICEDYKKLEELKDKLQETRVIGRDAGVLNILLRVIQMVNNCATSETNNPATSETEQKEQHSTSETNNPVTSETEQKEQYKINILKIHDVYNFCIEAEIINNSISEENFINAVYNADFKNILSNAESLKSKSACMYTITIISHFVDSPKWYKDTAHSINTEPNRCSAKKLNSEQMKIAKTNGLLKQMQ